MSGRLRKRPRDNSESSAQTRVAAVNRGRGELRRSSNSGAVEADIAPASQAIPDSGSMVNQALDGPGHPLDPDTKGDMEKRLGHNYGAIHTYPPGAARLSGSMPVSEPTDESEREADRVAEMATDPLVPATGRGASVQPEKQSHHKGGLDFSRVRIHTDRPAARSADEVDALAYTIGDHVVFGENQYKPQTEEGRRLLAHELIHVAQQGEAGLSVSSPVIQRQAKTPTVGPVSGEGGLAGDDILKRMSVIVGPEDTIRSIAKTLLPLWAKATPSSPAAGGASGGTPASATPLTEETLAKGLLVYNRYLVVAPKMSEWKVGLRFPLPIEETPATGERRLNPGSIAMWAASMDPAWTPLIDQRPSALQKPKPDELKQSVQSLVQSAPDVKLRGIGMVARAMKNAPEAEPFIKAVLDEAGANAFDTALSFLDHIVIHQFDLLASQEAGLRIIGYLQASTSKAPASPTASQLESLAKAKKLFDRLGVFTKETAETVKQIYIKDVPGCNCMTAAYKAFEGLYSKDVSRSISSQVIREAGAAQKKTGIDSNSFDRVMETVRARGKAGPPTTLKYKAKTDSWEPDPKGTLFSMSHPDVAGWYFFGLSLHGAYHSVVLAVDKTDLSNPRIYWMDQFSKGYNNEVTTSLTKTMKSFKPSYGFADSQVWQIMPAADTLIELH